MENNIQLIYDLIDLELTLLVFGNQLNDSDNLSLRDEFFKILKKLKKVNLPNRHKVYKDPQEIINLMIKRYNLHDDFAINKNRNKDNYVIPRHKAITICCYIFRHYSLSEIGCYFGNKDHSSIIHSKKTVKNMYETDKSFKNDFDELQLYFLGNIEIFD